MIQHRSLPAKLKKIEDIDLRKGFVIAPFDENSSFPVFFLEPDILIRGTDPQEDFMAKIKDLEVTAGISPVRDYYVAGKNEFMDQVNQIKRTIRERVLDKVVLSRIQLIENTNHTDALEIFYALCEKYPGAFIYIFQVPGAGCWLGATPEPLVDIGRRKVQTVSLAGTQNLNGIPAEMVQWKAKELEEQKFVTDFIEERLIRFGITRYEKIGPVNQPAANLVHLKSVFSFDTEALKGKIGEFISVLHPTPSVCGLPRRKAFEYIKNLEHHHREYYTGFLGPVNVNGATHVYVNLRCMKMLADKFALFVGAGITSGSDPESEWEETNQKMMTMLNVINSLNTQ
jgi:isochorismate synthase